MTALIWSGGYPSQVALQKDDYIKEGPNGLTTDIARYRQYQISNSPFSLRAGLAADGRPPADLHHIKDFDKLLNQPRTSTGKGIRYGCQFLSLP